MIARELDQYFATKASPDGGPSLQREGDDAFLSNVNAAYRRDCWAALRFPDVPYSEDQHFAQAMLAAGWAKAYNPDAAVLHAHDYPPVAVRAPLLRRVPRAARAVGHVEPLNINSARDVRALVAADRAWMREHGYGGAGAGALDRAVGRAPDVAQGLRRARVAGREAAGAGAEEDLAGGHGGRRDRAATRSRTPPRWRRRRSAARPSRRPGATWCSRAVLEYSAAAARRRCWSR